MASPVAMALLPEARDPSKELSHKLLEEVAWLERETGLQVTEVDPTNGQPLQAPPRRYTPLVVPRIRSRRRRVNLEKSALSHEYFYEYMIKRETVRIHREVHKLPADKW